MQQTQSTGQCQKVFETIGDYWALRIVVAIAKKEVRFCALERALTSVNPVTLTSRLKSLEGTGLLVKTKETPECPFPGYKLTASGLKFLPLAKRIATFANELHV